MTESDVVRKLFPFEIPANRLSELVLCFSDLSGTGLSFTVSYSAEKRRITMVRLEIQVPKAAATKVLLRMDTLSREFHKAQ